MLSYDLPPGLPRTTVAAVPCHVPRVVIRTPVELGLRGAGNVEVLSGGRAGDLVVQKGIYQLKQTGLGKSPQGGHFLADGTWHPKH